MNGRKRLFLPPCDLTSATLVFSIFLSSSLSLFLFFSPLSAMQVRVRMRIGAGMSRDRACFDDRAK